MGRLRMDSIILELDRASLDLSRQSIPHQGSDETAVELCQAYLRRREGAAKGRWRDTRFWVDGRLRVRSVMGDVKEKSVVLLGAVGVPGRSRIAALLP